MYGERPLHDMTEVNISFITRLESDNLLFFLILYSIQLLIACSVSVYRAKEAA